MPGSLWSGLGKPPNGELVKCVAEKALTKKLAKQHFKDTFSTALVEGEVLDSSDARKIKVRWVYPGGQHEAYHSKALLIGRAQEASHRKEAENANSGVENRGTEEELVREAGAQLIDPTGEDDPPEEEPLPAAVDPGIIPEADDMLNPHEQRWKEIPGGVPTCWRAESGKQEWQPHLQWGSQEAGQLGTQSRLKTWELMMPDVMEDACNTFNQCKPAGAKVLTIGELKTFIGMTLLQGLQNVRDRRDLWKLNQNREPWELFPGPELGSYGIGVKRYEEIMAHIGWYPLDNEQYSGDDEWKEIRYFVDKFNEKRVTILAPGWVICIDESTIKWRGFKAWHLTKGCPHVTNIARKPEPVCIEIKNSSCALSGIFWKLEIVENKAAMAKKKFCGGSMLAGTAQVLRLTDPLHNRGFAVVADSAFCSVPAAVECKKRGLDLTGPIKQAHRFYPKKKLETVEMRARGDTYNLTAEREGIKLLATAWADPNKPGKPRKLFLSTMGSTAAGNPCERPRKLINEITNTMDDVVLVVPRSKLVEHYFTHAGAIDKANRVRQDGLRLERNVEVKHWERRAWVSLLGFVGADAYAAWKLLGHKENEQTFLKKLCYELFYNEKGLNCDVLGEGGGKRKRGEGKKKEVAAGAPPQDRVYPHLVRPLKELPEAQDRSEFRLRCCFCGDKCTMYCRMCSRPDQERIVAFCNPSTGRDCMTKHLYE